MNAAFAHPTRTSPASDLTALAAAPVSEFMRWNDMTITPSRLPPAPETVRAGETATATDDG